MQYRTKYIIKYIHIHVKTLKIAYFTEFIIRLYYRIKVILKIKFCILEAK